MGHAGITTRRLAEEAGADHGLVHYYFGSMENLLGRVLERFTDRLIERQRAMYPAAEVGDDDRIRPLESGIATAEATGGDLVVMHGSGTRGATSRSRASCAGWSRSSRSTGSRSIP